MKNFNYYAPTQVAFGRNTESQVAELVKRHGGSKGKSWVNTLWRTKRHTLWPLGESRTDPHRSRNSIRKTGRRKTQPTSFTRKKGHRTL